VSISIAPKERINIVYKSLQENISVEKELPLKLLIVGEFGNFQKNLGINDRNVVNVNKGNFNDVLKNLDVKVSLDLVIDEAIHRQETAIEEFNDFSPDKLVKKMEHVEKLLKIRNALLMLKGPMGNIPEFRKRLEYLLKDSDMRQILREQING